MNYINKVEDILQETLNWSEVRGYKGYSKYDALNSPLLFSISEDKRNLRRFFSLVVSHSPINIRRFVGVKKDLNPKGLALFSRTYFNLYRLNNQKINLVKGLRIINYLIGISQKKKYSGHCWGYDHHWQNGSFYAPKYSPNSVVTINVGEALIDAFELVGNDFFLHSAESIISFIQNDLTVIEETKENKCVSYIPGSDWRVINVNAMISSYLARLYKITSNQEYKKLASKHMNWVIDKQTNEGAWYYSSPKESASIGIDNYHTGFVLDSLLNYMSYTGDYTHKKKYIKALNYYRDNLFLEDGHPKWENDKIYPADTHSSAQGIITFSLASSLDSDSLSQSKKILDWSINNMFAKGRFYYQKNKRWTKKFTLMRWCQAWMSFALSVFLINLKNENSLRYK